MTTPLVDITPIINSLVGLLGPLISLVMTIQIFKLVLSMITGLVGGLGSTLGGGVR
jgi:uncharacterized membrane protein